jgi:hypothetical protein
MKHLHDRGQTLTTWAIGLVFVLIGGLTANQYKVIKDVNETKTDIKVIKQSVENIDRTLSKIIKISVISDEENKKNKK